MPVIYSPLCFSVQAQAQYVVQAAATAPQLSPSYPSLSSNSNSAAYPSLGGHSGQPAPEWNTSSYPELAEYMGMELSRDMIAANMPEYLPENQVIRQ